MTMKRLVRNPRRLTRVDDPCDSQPSDHVWKQLGRLVPSPKARISCHGETIAPTQRQFQFRNLSDDPRLNLRLAGNIPSTRDTG
jgi:hypothetical protein